MASTAKPPIPSVSEPSPEPPAARRGAGERRGNPFDTGFLLGVAASSLLYAFLGAGGFLLATRIHTREHYYTLAAQALLHGHLYVPYSSLTFECFILHGHCFGYFGITPTLLRLPVVALTHATSNNSIEYAFFLLGFLAASAGAWWVNRQLVAAWGPEGGFRHPRLVGALLALLELGLTPMLYLVTRPLVYEEAILWGVAFAALALGAALALRRKPRAVLVAVLLVADLLAVSSRPPVGASALVATVWLAFLFFTGRGVERRRRWAATWWPVR